MRGAHLVPEAHRGGRVGWARPCAATMARVEPLGFASIELLEPSKITRAPHVDAGDELVREAVVLGSNRDGGQVHKARVSLNDDRVLAWDW